MIVLYNRILLLFNTIKYLRFKQLYYRVFYSVRNKFLVKNYSIKLKNDLIPLNWNDSILFKDCYFPKLKFNFLNQEIDFEERIDWNYNKYGKLWTYNLNYFDFLNQKTISKREGLKIINDYIRNDSNLKDGKEPYPISLRGINWIKFLSTNKIVNQEINQTLFNHYNILKHNLEFHLLGNHLLENGFSLLFGAYYYRDERLYWQARKILICELNEQILEDGAHFELSPMYHQILLHRLLDCIQLIVLNKWKVDTLLSFLNERAISMLSWLEAITFENGNVPMVNDCAFDVAPKSEQLFQRAQELNLNWPITKLRHSGYRMFKNKNFEFLIDVGNVGPSYQPGHAHSDTFSFCLNINYNPFIVDTGTSTYEKNEVRQTERNTESHNTVKVNNINQSQVWGGFRVASRAEIIKLNESENRVSAVHNGYKNIGVLHERTFLRSTRKITIEDFLITNKINIKSEAFVHFHPEVENFKVKENSISFNNFNCKIIFTGDFISISKESYMYAQSFNKLEKAQKVKIIFNKQLKTEIIL